MSEMFKKIINVLLAENIDFEILQAYDRYVVRSIVLKDKVNAWYIRDNPLTGIPRLYNYINNYKDGLSFSRYQDYVTVVSNVVASL